MATVGAKTRERWRTRAADSLDSAAKMNIGGRPRTRFRVRRCSPLSEKRWLGLFSAAPGTDCNPRQSPIEQRPIVTIRSPLSSCGRPVLERMTATFHDGVPLCRRASQREPRATEKISVAQRQKIRWGNCSVFRMPTPFLPSMPPQPIVRQRPPAPAAPMQ
jgi:hypothetical protein